MSTFDLTQQEVPTIYRERLKERITRGEGTGDHNQRVL